ncbi:putative ABC transporter permease protein [Actinoplanes missouriensis 431]|uniref:Putative ABC transporter permease protein n=1 Tax=Actinoplanes missouriensis (strain ATCC 14538 / DSM 43046 / CBS 188.64 / JCM 3121 / NBRC 102363 / NCIMB 12654 / NRRL B-3342 / UNCC 431) TaxID=512565 RepID=I0H6R5_ACTM4|nr:ABC transporter permease [Actinoplanes missouriensis]BAL88702.1 putative ABC transporter permease protein [Actinoplanes missouriensis 431]
MTAVQVHSGTFRDAVAAEIMKVRTLRSTWAFLAGGVLATTLGAMILLLMVQSYDADSPADRANYETADPTVVTMPFVMFFVGAIGAMLITSEYTTRTLGPSLLAVPQRGVLFGAKAAVAGLIGFGGGAFFALAAFAVARLTLGDRPAPFNPWPQWTDAVPTVLCATVVAGVTCLVALGLGALTRSTAAALTTLGGLVLVAPIFAHFLPVVWQLRLASVLLPNLTPQLAGSDHPYLLSQGGAVAVTAGYLVLALGAGALAFRRRDAA